MSLRPNITLKLVGYLLVVSLLPLFIFAFASYKITRSTIVAQATDSSRRQLAGQRAYLELEFAQIESLAANIAGVQDILTALERADAPTAGRSDFYDRLSTQARVGAILNGYSNIRGLVSIDLYTLQGRHFHVGDTLEASDIDDAARRAYYQSSLDSPRPLVWQGVADNVNIHSTSRKVVIATKVLRDYSEARQVTGPVGMLIISYSTDYLFDHFAAVDVGRDAYLLVIDSNDRLVYHPGHDLIGSPLTRDFRALITSPEGSEDVRLGGAKVLLTHTVLPATQWRLVGVVPQDTLLLPMRDLDRAAWVLAALCLVIIALAARTYARSVVAPIKAISSGFRRIQQNPGGDYENLPAPRTRDEIGEMVEWFNAFLAALRLRRQSDELIWSQANFDSLTGLPNRRLFHDRLDVATRKVARDHEPVAVLFIDLDRFKEVNDALGHEIGDELLVEAASRISGCVRAADTVGRFGGDEFTVLVTAIEDIAGARLVAEKILRALHEPFTMGGQTCHVSASIGICFCPDDADNADDLLKQADLAMYAAKADGRNRCVPFSKSMQEGMLALQSLRGELRGALVAGQFSLHYQPILELATGQVHKAEALLRWRHPVRGYVSPVEFIPIAEESGLVNDIGEWVFEQAAAQAQHWSQVLGHPIQISINRSPVEFRDQHDEGRWPARLRELGLFGGAIAVEITEGLLLNVSSSTAAQLSQYREAGIEVSIDDFGTGYSSMAYLKKFDIDYVKIDQSFVKDMETDADDRTITEAIIGMAHKLGIKVIAEGIETPGQRDLLLAAGCEYGQGYLFSRPLPAPEFEARFITGRIAHDVESP